MLPGYARLRLANRRVIHAKSLGQLSLCYFPTSRPEFSDNIVGQLGPTTGFTPPGNPEAKPEGMATILSVAKPFQIGKPVIRWDSVSVVDFMPLWTGAEEGSGYQRSDPTGVTLVVTPETHVKTTSVTQSRLEDSSSVETVIWSNPPYPSKAGNLIPALVPNDGTPLFGGYGRLRVHRKTLLSVPCSGAVHTVAAALIIARIQHQGGD